jgi:hypothetical protein
LFQDDADFFPQSPCASGVYSVEKNACAIIAVRFHYFCFSCYEKL